MANPKNGRTVKQLKEELRRLTRAVNIRIAEYRAEHESVDEIFTKVVNKLKLNSGVDRGYEGGEIGLGVSGKNKSELERQLAELERFEAKEWFSPEAASRLEGKYKRSYDTFVKNHGEISEDEWEAYVTMLGTMGSYLAGYGYADIEGSMANIFVNADARGKRKMAKYVRDTGRELQGKGATPEDFIETLTSNMIEDGVLDEDEYGW